MKPIDETDEELNENFISECCGEPILGEIVDDLGICSRCHEWSGVIENREIRDYDI